MNAENEAPLEEGSPDPLRLEALQEECYGKHRLNHPPWPGKIETTCESSLTAGNPGKEHETNELPPDGIIWERSEGERRHQPTSPTTSQSPPRWSPPWLSDACTARKHPESGQLDRQPGETGHQASKQRPWAQAPLPNRVSGFASTRSPCTIHSPRVRQAPTLRLWKGSPFLQQEERHSQSAVKTRPTPRAMDSPRRWTRQQEPPRSHREWPDLNSHSHRQTVMGRKPPNLWQF